MCFVINWLYNCYFCNMYITGIQNFKICIYMILFMIRCIKDRITAIVQVRLLLWLQWWIRGHVDISWGKKLQVFFSYNKRINITFLLFIKKMFKNNKEIHNLRCIMNECINYLFIYVHLCLFITSFERTNKLQL